MIYVAKEVVEMEHRSDFRTCASMNLLIYKDGLPVGVGITRDISNTGMFVQTSYVDPDPHPTLEFELLYSQKRPGERKRYRALVNEQRSGGLALKFDATGSSDARKLAAMVEWVVRAHENNRHEISLQGKNRQRITPNRLVRIPNGEHSVR